MENSESKTGEKTSITQPKQESNTPAHSKEASEPTAENRSHLNGKDRSNTFAIFLQK